MRAYACICMQTCVHTCMTAYLVRESLLCTAYNISRLPYEDNPSQFSPDRREGHGAKEFYGALESINEQMACQ